MSLPVPPLPPSGRFIEYVRKSSRALTQAEAVSISNANIERLLLSPAFTGTYHRISSTSHGLALPLKFPSPLSELNLLSILALLNIASGYRVSLHQETGRGAWDSIRAFVYGLYLSSAADGEGDLLSARGMQTLSEAKIAELLGVSLHIERQHESIQGLTIGEVGGPGWELVQLLRTLLTETGKILVDGGYPNLGSFVAEALKEGETASRERSDPAAAADVVLERLVRAIPGFQDMAVVNNTPIYCFKKALFLINGVSIRFGAKDPSPFPVPQTSHLPVFTDNVLPSILIHFGIVDLSTAASPALAALFPGAGADDSTLAALFAAAPEPAPSPVAKKPVLPVDGPTLTPAQSYVLRAAAVEACERILVHARAMSAAGRGAPWLADITLPDLDNWLWAVAKDRADYRALPRFALRNTLFF
ncbi:hypothetical protein EDB89DRAFT_1940063 [Lactarius sanguifluus]|nr:hypothetical protein EDB89DRAFT_1940063 [Lactarius sanguifluus]